MKLVSIYFILLSIGYIEKLMNKQFTCVKKMKNL